MLRKRRRRAGLRRRPLLAIPTAGMADIAFLLIVFFVVTTVRTLDRTSLDLPGSKIRANAEQNSAMIVLARGEQGESDLVYKFSNGTSQSAIVSGPRAIRAEAANVVADDPTRVFEIKADGDVPCEEVGRILDALTEAGAETILMLTEPLSKGAS